MKLINKALFKSMATITLFAAFAFVFDRVASAHEEGECGQECRAQLAQVRAATAQYHTFKQPSKTATHP